VKLLALDTSSISCSVAVKIDDAIIERYEEQPREHTRLLLPMIRAVLRESGLTLSELDAIVLGNGPGSFIGMRIAASVAQGLAYGSGLNIVPVSSLAAVAAEVFANGDAAEVVVTQDAHMKEVYLGIYARGSDDLPVAAMSERLQVQDCIAELNNDAGGPRIAAGAGWQRYPELLAKNIARLDTVSDRLHPRAQYLLGLGARSLETGLSIGPAELMPAYLRQKVAEKPASRS
jgi:tRNA threonylcarbamoyladenosine biosynthesis protein TsaB